MPLDEDLKQVFEKEVEEYLIEKISKIAKDNLGKPKEISENDHFTNDLLFDSLDYAYLIVDLEDDFNIEIEGAGNFFTRKQCRGYVVKKIEEREDRYEAVQQANYNGSETTKY